MKKVLFLLVFILISSSIFASTFVFDRAFILTIKEDEYLEEKLEKLSSEVGFSIFALSSYTTNGLTSNEYCEKFLQEDEREGIVLFINTESMEYLVSFTSNIESSLDLTSFTISDLNNTLIKNLSKGRFFDVFSSFADFVVENVKDKEAEGIAENATSDRSILTSWLFILAISLSVGFFSMRCLVSKMEEKQIVENRINNADNEVTYKTITDKSDELLYSNTSSRPRAKIIILRILVELLR